MYYLLYFLEKKMYLFAAVESVLIGYAAGLVVSFNY